MKKFTHRKGLLVAMMSVIVLTGCDRNKDEDRDITPRGIRIMNHTIFGEILTDSVGRALYFFSRDADGNSACSGNCLNNWPPYYSANAAEGEDIEDGDIGTITRSDGTKQTTYKSWPLYYYASDTDIGQINGDKVGENWFVAKPDYSVMLVQNQLVGRNGDEYTEDLSPGQGMTRYLADAYGRTLYGFSNDKFNTNQFTMADFSNNGVWPIYEEELQRVPSILNPDDFAVINVHGRNQLTYKGWPLYHFGQDTQRGETKGVDVPSVGVWPVLKTDSPEAPAP